METSWEMLGLPVELLGSLGDTETTELALSPCLDGPGNGDVFTCGPLKTSTYKLVFNKKMH
jgi:hypothetical protein